MFVRDGHVAGSVHWAGLAAVAGEPTPADEVDEQAPGDARTESDIDVLRSEAEGLGVQVDRRWGSARLRQEIDNVKEATDGHDDVP